MAPLLRIVVYGEPAPQGSKKFVGTYHGKDGRTHGMMGESSKKVKPWRQDVVAAAVEARAAAGNPEPLDCPLIVRMIFTVPKPKSAPKRRRLYAMRKPDVSKLSRSTEDALTTAMIWTDDSRIVEYSRLAKVFPGEDPEALASPGVIVEIRAIT
jgi:Holliday junction resolvase RusA-like endonuclease